MVALFLAGCESTSPSDKELAAFILDFCAGQAPDFVAFQNQDGPWTPAPIDANGTITLQVTQRFGLALVQSDGEEIGTEVLYGTRDEFAVMNGLTCLEDDGNKILNGSVAGVSASQSARVSLSNLAHVATSANSAFSFVGLPNRPLDLVAHRLTTSTQVPDRVIVRRALTNATGSTLSALDFNNVTEAQAQATNVLTITGLGAGEFNFYTSGFMTMSGTNHIFTSTSFTAATQPLYGVPAALTQAGDIHRIVVDASSNSGGRGVAQFHRNPGDRTAALGPPLSTPTITNAGTAPDVFLRAQLPSQQEYGAVASVTFEQSPPGAAIIYSVVIMTSGYAGGTPTTWELQMPDLSAVAGYPAGALFLNNQPFGWFAEAAGDGAVVFVGGPPTDGLIARFADRASPAASQVFSTRPSRGATQSGFGRRMLSRR
jgi:hypothetical protein